jgi:drug/metabolite transporter (DMT)-like permease
MTHHWGYVGAVASALLFGLGATFNKIAVANVNTTVVAGLTYLFAGLALAVIRFSPMRSRVMRLLKTPTITETTFCRRDFLGTSFCCAFGVYACSSVVHEWVKRFLGCQRFSSA